MLSSTLMTSSDFSGVSHFYTLCFSPAALKLRSNLFYPVPPTSTEMEARCGFGVRNKHWLLLPLLVFMCGSVKNWDWEQSVASGCSTCQHGIQQDFNPQLLYFAYKYQIV